MWITKGTELRGWHLLAKSSLVLATPLKATTLGALVLRWGVIALNGHQRVLCKQPFCLEYLGVAKKHRWGVPPPFFSICSNT